MSTHSHLTSTDGAANSSDANYMRCSGKLNTVSHGKDTDNLSSIDIVLVHGLGIDSSSPWTSSTSSIWVQDIPNQIEKARIMTFTYNREAIEDTASVLSPEGITQIAEALLIELLTARDVTMDSRPPIAFVAHDIGGSIVKMALVIAKKRPQYYSILEDCSHITFFYTPHRAVDMCSWEEYVSTTAVASSLPLSTAFDIARRVGVPPTFLEDLSSKFISLRSRWSIISIYQEAGGIEPSSKRATIDKYLATTGLIHEISIGRIPPHKDAFRFSEFEPAYLTIVNTLTAEIDSDYRACLSRLFDVSPAFTILDDAPTLSITGHEAWPLADYDEWLKHLSPSVISTIGDSGSGKHPIASALFRKLKDESRLAVYFSFIQTDARRSSATSFLASVAFQLLIQDPGRFPRIRDLFVALDKSDEWTVTSLLILFYSLLDTNTERGPLYLIVDGFHRCMQSSESLLEELLVIASGKRLATPVKFALFSQRRNSIEKVLEAHELLHLPEVILTKGSDLSELPIESALAPRVVKKWPYFKSNDAVDEDSRLDLYYALCSDDEAVDETIIERLGSIDKFQDIEDVFLIATELGRKKFIEHCLTSTANNSSSRLCNVSRESDGYRALHIAAEKGYEDIVLLLLKFNAEVDVLDHEERTPLVLAAIAGEVRILSLLLEHHANAQLGMSDDPTTLTYVVKHAQDSCRHADVVKKLLDTGLDPNACGVFKISALHWAALHGNFEITSALLQCRKVDATATGLSGMTALHYLAMNPVAEINVAQALIEAGNNPVKPNENGQLPLHIASKYGNIKLMEFLIDKHPSSITLQTPDHRTALHFGISSAESIDWLLDRGLNIDAKDNEGNTALMLAVEAGFAGSVNVLLKRDANVEVTWKDGITVLHAAVHHDKLDIGRELLKWCPTILSCRDNTNASALHHAIDLGKSEFAMMLLEEHYAKIIEDSPGNTRVDLHAEQTIKEETPLMSAVRMRNQTVIRKLCELGAATEHVNKNGDSALLLAARLGDCSVLDALLDDNVGNCPDVTAGGGARPTALHEAARFGNRGIIESLIEHNANIGAQGGQFGTALGAAAAYNWTELACHLIRNWGQDAGVNLPAGNFANPLGAALWSRSFELLPHLLDAKADVNAVDAQGRSSFHIAAARGSWDVILKLRNAEGAKSPKRDKQDRTLLHHAAVNGRAEVFRNLLDDEELASPIDARDVDDWMPLHWACKGNNVDVIRFICGQGNSTITEATRDGWTPENIAITSGANDAVNFIKNLRRELAKKGKDDNNGGEVSEEALDPTGKQLQPGRRRSQHPGIDCDGCFVNPIVGVRWRCADCQHFNFCFKCFWTVRETHDSEHEFKAILKDPHLVVPLSAGKRASITRDRSPTKKRAKY